MAFVRKKKVRGKHYLQIVESYRVDGKVRQRMLLHVGDYPCIEAAVGSWEEGTERFGDRRVRAFKEKARGKAKKARTLVELDEDAVSEERREAERWMESRALR